MSKQAAVVRAFDGITAFYPWIANRQKDYYVYAVEYNTLAVSAVAAQQSFNIDRDSDFIVLSMSVVMATAAAGTTEQTFPLPLAQVQDSGSGQNWFNTTQNLGNVAGRMTVDGAGPYILEHPRWCNAGAQVIVSLTNLEATARRIWLAFHGCRVYRGMNPIGGITTPQDLR